MFGHGWTDWVRKTPSWLLYWRASEDDDSNSVAEVMSMFSPWPRWRQTDGWDGHQPQEGRSLLCRPSKEWGRQWQQGGWRHSECFYLFLLQTFLPRDCFARDRMQKWAGRSGIVPIAVVPKFNPSLCLIIPVMLQRGEISSSIFVDMR